MKNDPKFSPPPLFGLPISVKANVSFKGRDQFKGYVQDLEIPMEVDSVIVEHLQELGAIPFVLTNVPQTLLTYSCENPVYGSTSHPMDKERTSGGSSGGEAALVASGGSLVGKKMNIWQLIDYEFKVSVLILVVLFEFRQHFAESLDSK